MPDMLHILLGNPDPPELVDARNGKTTRLFGLPWGKISKIRGLSVSSRGAIAALDIGPSFDYVRQTRILLYERVQGKPTTYKQAGALIKQVNKTGVLITCPHFLPDGRLAHLQLTQRPDKKSDAAVMVAEGNGANPRLWFRLPPANGDSLASQESTWTMSRDGKTVAYVRGGVISVKNVDPL
jgi:hypothetical protein